MSVKPKDQAEVRKWKDKWENKVPMKNDVREDLLLTESWFSWPNWCLSWQITGNLVKSKLKVAEQYVHVLPMNTECIVQGVKVTLLDANQWVYPLTNEYSKPILQFPVFRQNDETFNYYDCVSPKLSWGSHVAVCSARWPDGTPHRWLPSWSIHGALPRAAGSQDTDPLSGYNVSSPLAKLLFGAALFVLYFSASHIN